MGTTTSQLQSQKEVSAPLPFCSIVVHLYGTGALSEAEQIDRYRAICQNDKSNAIARARQSYFYNPLPLSSKDLLLERLQTYQSQVPDLLRRELSKVVIVPLMASADGGMPHTRPPHYICLPDSAKMLPLDTYVHELWHLHQRAYYSKWKQFFAKYWKFTVYTGPLPEPLITQARLNPDTLTDPFWLWKGEWVPICLFTDPVKPSFQQTAVWFYNVRTGLHQQAPPPDMTAFFSSRVPPSAYEHPCEMAAYLLTTTAVSAFPAYQTFESVFGPGIQIKSTL